MAIKSNKPLRLRRSTGLRTDVTVVGVDLHLLPVHTRVPLKFGPETLTSVTCARVRLQVRDGAGRTAFGWGETPLSVQWAWPTDHDQDTTRRVDAMIRFCRELVRAWAEFDHWGHPLEIGHAFNMTALPAIRQRFNEGRDAADRIPLLAALVCLSAFDIALHDAYGRLHDVPIYQTYSRGWMNHDLSWYLEPAENLGADFRNLYPDNYLIAAPPSQLNAWHLVGGLDPLDESEQNGTALGDHLPILLSDWIIHDGLTCLKIKLRGNDPTWDYGRIVRVGQIALAHRVKHLSTDFNCTVTDPEYVIEILDRLKAEQPAIYDLILYVEQPFPYEMELHPIDVRKVSERKPLFMDESAHSWQQIRLGRALGWTGVALKTCKTQTGALLSLCWAKAHGMQVMVQDLTNPMLAQIPHVLLAAHAGTICGVETNAMQFYPQASLPEAVVHPGLYSRRNGHVDLSTVRGPGFGYQGAEAARTLAKPIASSGHAAVVPPWHVDR